jgi:2-oxoglutarate ferredoxin oxidoreductase subunit alpha
MIEDVRLGVNGKKPVHFTGRMGGMIPDPDVIYQEIVKIVGKK